MQSLTNINRGICQGIVTGDIYYPTDNVALFTLKVRDSRIDPVSGSKKKHYIQFTAFDELAELIRVNVQSGQIIYVVSFYNSGSSISAELFFNNSGKKNVVRNLIIQEKGYILNFNYTADVDFIQQEADTFDKVIKSKKN